MIDLDRLVSLVAGLLLVMCSFYWTAQVMMVRGAEPPMIARIVLRASRNFLQLAGRVRRDPVHQRNLWALYVPFSLISMVLVTIILACFGFALILYGITSNTMRDALVNSISAMSVLGFGGLPPTLRETIVAGLEAFTGPIFVALLIGYIVNIYADYSQQRDRVLAMDRQLGASRTGLELLETAAAGPGLDSLTPVWTDWVEELSDAEQTSQTVDGYLLIFAPAMTKHWSTDAVIAFDAANLRNTLITSPFDSEAQRCLDVGSKAIEQIASHYGRRTVMWRRKKTTAMITQQEFEHGAARLRAHGVSVADDLQRAWEQFEYARGGYAAATAQLERMR